MMTEVKKNRLSGYINPGIVTGIEEVAAARMIISSVVKLRHSKEDLNTLMNEAPVSRTVKLLDSIKLPKQPLLDNFAQENSVYRINIFNTDAEKLFSNAGNSPLQIHFITKHERNNKFL